MSAKSLFRLITFYLLMLAVFACASGGGGSKVELSQIEADIAVFPQMGHSGYVYSVAFSHDGKLILSGSFDETIKLWDAGTGKEIRTLLGHTERVRSVAFSPDGKLILSGSDDGTSKLWDTETGKEIRAFSGHTRGIRSVTFSPDGRLILSGSSEGTLKLWDVETGLETRTFEHPGGTMSASFSPDGKYILSSGDRTIKQWNIETGQEVKNFSGDIGNIFSVAYSPDGKYILSGGAATIKLWDKEKGQEIKNFPGLTTDIYSVAYSPDGKFILSGSRDGILKLWNVETGQEVRTFSGQTNNVYTVVYSPQERYIISGYRDNSINLWDARAGRKIRTFSGHTSRINTITFSPDENRIISGSSDGTVKLWDMETGREIGSFQGYSGVLSPDGKYILSGSVDNSLVLWDVETKQEIRSFLGHTERIVSVAFSPDGKRIISGSGDGTVKLWDMETEKEIRTFTGLRAFSYDCVKLSPDGTQILFPTDPVSVGTVKLCDAETGQEIRTFETRSSACYFAFSPDGKYMVSCYLYRNIRLWDVETGKEIRTFSGHTNDITSINFDPNGKQILSSSQDGTTRLWDVATGKEIVQFISFSGSDSQIASATRALTVKAQTAAASNEGEWLSITPDGYYQASPRGDRYLNVRVNNSVTGIDSFRSVFYNPDVVQARLQSLPDPASRANITIQQIAAFFPPTVTIQSPANFSTTSTVTANLSVAIADQNQPIRNVKILVNGRLVGRSELSVVKGAAGLRPQNASLTVTGNQKMLNFNLPLNLDPGDNIIEVVAFNGYAESRSRTELTWDAPAGQRPPLPNLWILAVGVNDYTDTNIQDLNYAVADAKGLIDSLKAQEGKRYARVNSLLIADGEPIAPTAANIRRNLSFLDQAGERDVVLLFLAGHGVSANAGKFLFLPNDVRLRGETVVESGAISDNDIVKVLDRAGNLLVFIDACQSGGVDNDRLVRSLMGTNAFVFASSRGYEKSQERRELGHGVFTYSIIEGLRGAVAARAQDNVTVLSLSGFVSDDVPRITNGAQNPKAYSLGFYDFPMAVIK